MLTLKAPKKFCAKVGKVVAGAPTCSRDCWPGLLDMDLRRTCVLLLPSEEIENSFSQFVFEELKNFENITV